MEILLLITASLFIIYNVFILYNFGVPESLSETSYLLKEKYKQPWWFSLVCVIIIIGLLPNWIIISTINTQFLVFIACVGVLFIAASPFFLKGLDKPVHYTSGVVTAVCFILWFIFNGQCIWLMYILLFFIPLIVWKPKCFIYFIEIIAYIFVILFLI